MQNFVYSRSVLGNGNVYNRFDDIVAVANGNRTDVFRIAVVVLACVVRNCNSAKGQVGFFSSYCKLLGNSPVKSVVVA